MRRPSDLLLSLLALTLAIVATAACNASVGGPSAEGGDCGYGDFVCGDGSCVPRANVCNGTENCADGTDEDDCATRCERNQYRCRDGVTCISQASLCDEREDCPGGDDEATCGTEECANGFTCPDGTCLPANAKCNGAQECSGGEDEAPETCSPARCPNADDLRCGDGQTCVPKARQCDGVPHCVTGEDEGAAACAGQGGGADEDPAGGKDGDTGGDKPNDGGDGPDKPGGGGTGRPCGDVPAEGRCGKSDVLEWCDNGRLERQSCRRQGLVCGRNGDGDAACVAPSGAEPTESCGGVDATGECQGNTLVFCVNGVLRTQDCGRSGKICNATPGVEAKCELPAEDTCGGAPATGECDGNTLVWCDATTAERKTYDCAASGMTCGASTEGDLAFSCQAAPCGDVDYFGTCEGDTLRYCQNGNVLVEVDCRAELGLGCGLQNETVGNNCVAASDAGGACGDVTFEGTCQGDTVVWCNGGSLDTYDCGTSGQTCGDVAGIGKWCVASGAFDGCGDIDFQGTCEGDVALWCASGTLRSKDCGDEGKACGFVSEAVGYFCTAEAAAPTCENRCNAGQIAGASPACYCDSLCAANGDCCGGVESYEDVCGAAEPTPAAPSCEGHCGELAPVPGSSPACYCDDACETNGDCCDDYAGICTSVSV